MKTIVLVGARPGLEFSLAKKSGSNGFQVALVSRNQEKLDQFSNQLHGMGVEATGFFSDV